MLLTTWAVSLFSHDFLVIGLCLQFFLGSWQLLDAMLGSIRGSRWQQHYLASALTYLAILISLYTGLEAYGDYLLRNDVFEWVGPIMGIFLPTVMAGCYIWLNERALAGKTIIHG